jgi:hypothetical protein
MAGNIILISPVVNQEVLLYHKFQGARHPEPSYSTSYPDDMAVLAQG